MSIYLRVPGYFFPPAMVQHSCLPSLLFITLLPFSLSLYLPDSNPLLSFNNQVREVHLYTGIYDFVYFLFTIYKHVQMWDYLSSYKVWLPRHTDLFSPSLFPPPQITTGEGCTCRWRWMGECQEVMFRRLTVSIWPLNTQRFLFYVIHSIIRSQRGCNN